MFYLGTDVILGSNVITNLAAQYPLWTTHRYLVVELI